MTALIRAELLKQRSIPTGRSLLGGMLTLTVFAVLLHGLSLPPDNVGVREDQLDFVFRWGALLGSLFASILGAVSITGEFRHGTIRPTLLLTPRRERVVVAKVLSAVVWGGAFGLLAVVVGTAVAVASLEARSIDVALDSADYARLLFGGTATAALWAAIGVGLGALVRQQVATVAGLAIWLLFIESLLVPFVPDVGRLAPGAAGAALAGIDLDALLAPAAGGSLLLAYAVAAVAAGAVSLARRDVG